MIAADPYGKFIPGPARGLPQYVTTTGLVEGNLASAACPVPANVLHFDTPFLTDIAHNADPAPQDTDHNPATPPVAPTPDADSAPSADFARQPAGTYDDEMLNAHFSCGDGRCNENIALSTIHQIFHSEHDRLVDDIKNTLDHRHLARPASPRWPSGSSPTGAGRLERRAPVPGRAVRDRDGVPASRVRGVRPQGAAGRAAVPRLQPGHQPGHRGRVRPRRLPVRPLDARRRRRPRRHDADGPDRQLAAAAARRS